jgi:phosphomannomutase
MRDRRKADEPLVARVRAWIDQDPDPRARQELLALLEAPDVAATDLADRFAGTLTFGTAGLRGVLGAGPNRMNRAVVARATWGLAQELLASVPDAAERGVFVGGDARRMSEELCQDVAAILAAAGLRVTRFASPVPTPLVGFAVKQRRAAAGVVVTASHNPPEYNGYKVYWEDAAQIVPPVDARIAARIDAAPPASRIPRPPIEAFAASGRIATASPDIARAYVDAVLALRRHPGAGDRSLTIVYTPLHGVGNALVRQVLGEAGFTQVMGVAEQEEPDGAFPTVAFPNPEEPGAMDLAFALARRTGADLVLANDPDADRLAVAVPDGGGLRQLTGNELGVLLGHSRIAECARASQAAVLASVVSSPLLGHIARDFGVRYEETLTGFKWIAHRSIELEREGFRVIFAFEEALGYAVGDVVRDKDGISAALLVAELAAVARERGRTLVLELESIARRWGIAASSQVNLTRKGREGVLAIQAMMQSLRSAPPQSIAGQAVVAISDYEAGVRRDVRAGTSTPLLLPQSNVLSFELEAGGRVVARPSGTEPKAKFYFDIIEPVRPDEPVGHARTRSAARLEALARDFMTRVR